MQKNHHNLRPDYILFLIISILVVWGILTVGTTSFPLSLQKYGNPWYYLSHQLVVLLIGIFLAVIFFKLPINYLRKSAPFFFLLNIIFVGLVFLPKVGVELGGGRRWISVFGIELIQPSEFLKVTFVLYLASWLSQRINFSKKKRITFLFLPFLIVLAILLVLLMLQPDMSTLGIIFSIGILMYFASGAPFWHIILMILGGGGMAAFLIKIAPYRLKRIIILLNPEVDPLGIGYQLRQALIAIGSGKIFGIGSGFALGQSRQKFGFLPYPMTDSIFAIIGEELGFVGCILLITLFLIFFWRGLRISHSSSDFFQKLTALGITSFILLQAFFNISGMIGLLPLSGIPLPFFSYGGSHLITEMIAIGILLNISKR